MMLLWGAVTMGGLTACTGDDSLKEERSQDKNSGQTTEAPVYRVSIEATLNDSSETRGVTFGDDGVSITTRFEEGDKVYVYNETKEAFACSPSGDPTPLTLAAADITGNGLYCKLIGDLAFYKYNASTTQFDPVTPGVNDTYSLFYNMPNVDMEKPENSCFHYTGIDKENEAKVKYTIGAPQVCTAASASAHDFAMATGVTMTVENGMLKPASSVSFQTLQSMFRLKLLFVKGTDEYGQNVYASHSINRLRVASKRGTLISEYKPLDKVDKYGRDDFTVSLHHNITSGGIIFLSMLFNYELSYDISDEALLVAAGDNHQNTYSLWKAPPAGGFQRGKFYYSTLALNIESTRPSITPDVTANGMRQFNLSGGDLAYTISGTSLNYNFNVGDYTTCSLLLSGLNAEYRSDDGVPLISTTCDKDLTLILDGDNTITCSYAGTCINAGQANLKIIGNGTLTVKNNNPDYCGLVGKNYSLANNNHTSYGEVNVSEALAGTGYVVKRIYLWNNTWRYTVSQILNSSGSTTDYTLQEPVNWP